MTNNGKLKIFKIMRENIADFPCEIFRWAMNALVPKHRLIKALSLPEYCNRHVGIACTLCSPLAHVRARKISRSYNIQQPKSSLFSWPSSSSSSHDKSPDGDILGSESGVHMCCSQDVQPWEDAKSCVPKLCLQGRVHLAKKRDIPPLISILRKDGPNYKGHLPLSPHSDGEDGRLQLGENGEEQCEYLATIRENGRLIMNLVTVNNSINSDNDWDKEIGADVEEHGEGEQ